jgi:hypothetical protein
MAGMVAWWCLHPDFQKQKRKQKVLASIRITAAKPFVLSTTRKQMSPASSGTGTQRVDP